jgi:hypothetical protein
MLRKQRLRPLTEAEAYARCHGMHDSEVRIVKLEPRRPRYDLEVSGEDLRQSFEAKLAHRELEDEPVGGTA